MLRMFGCATRCIIGHVPQPNTTQKLSPSMPLYGGAATRMAELCAVLQTDYWVWLAYFCGDRRRLTRSSLSRPAKQHRSKHDKVQFLSSAGAPFLRPGLQNGRRVARSGGQDWPKAIAERREAVLTAASTARGSIRSEPAADPSPYLIRRKNYRLGGVTGPPLFPLDYR